MGPNWTTRYHQTSTLVSIRASVLTCMDARGCIRSFIRLLLHRMSSLEEEEEKKKANLNKIITNITTTGCHKNHTWIESKVVYEALPSNEGDLLDGRRRAAEPKFLQM